MPTTERAAATSTVQRRRAPERAADGRAAGSRARPRRGYPTPIALPGRVAAGLAVVALVLLALLLRFAPSVPIIALGGALVALVLSFPVRLLSHVMPRGLAHG